MYVEGVHFGEREGKASGSGFRKVLLYIFFNIVLTLKIVGDSKVSVLYVYIDDSMSLSEIFPKVRIILKIFIVNNLIFKLNLQLCVYSKKVVMQECPFAKITDPNSFNIFGIYLLQSKKVYLEWVPILNK